MQLENENLNVVYIAPDLAPWSLDNASLDGLTFEKEVVYNGDFVRDDGTNPAIHFGVNDNVLRHWHDQVQLFLANGVKIPMPVEHTNDPTKTRAHVVGSRIGRNAKDKNALYLKTRFVDSEAAKLAKTSDVSIYVPHEFKDGNGNLYKRPIRHVAFTAYPTIPGLGEFQAIAASFIPGQPQPPAHAGAQPPAPVPSQQPPSALLPLAQQLGVPNAETLDDAAITAAIVGVFTVMKDKIAELEGEETTEPGEPQMTTPATQPSAAKKKLPPAIAASLSNLLKDNRTAKIDALVAAGCILPPVRDALVAQYCAEPSLALSLDVLSMDDNATGLTDAAFDAMCEALKKNKAIAEGEKTGAQGSALELSNPSIDPQKNPLIAGAERRRAEYQAELATRRN